MGLPTDFLVETAPTGGEIVCSWTEGPELVEESVRVRLFRSDDAYPVRVAVNSDDPNHEESDAFDYSSPTFQLLYEVDPGVTEGPFLETLARRGGATPVDGEGGSQYQRVDRYENLGGVGLLEKAVRFRINDIDDVEEVQEHRMRFRDQGLAAGTWYYALLVETSDGEQFQHVGTAIASDASFAFGDRMYSSLPTMYRRYEQRDNDEESGPLERFMQLIGGALDRQATGDRGLLDLFDVHSAPGPLLTLLADKIGWWVDPRRSFPVQRHRLLGARKLYQKVGTIEGTEALAYQVADKRVRVREFAMNIFHANAPELPYRDEEGNLVRSRSKTVDLAEDVDERRYPLQVGPYQEDEEAPFFDKDDAEVVHSWRDTLHYTYDTRKPSKWFSFDDDGKPDGWYAYDSVGLFLQEAASVKERSRILSAADYYLPLNIRAVLIQASTATVDSNDD